MVFNCTNKDSYLKIMYLKTYFNIPKIIIYQYLKIIILKLVIA